MDASFSIAPVGGGIPASQRVVKTASPANGASLSFSDNSIDQSYYLTPSSLIASASIALPSEGNSVIGQQIAIFSTQTITTLNITGAINLLSNPGTIVGGTGIMGEKLGANTWMFY